MTETSLNEIYKSIGGLTEAVKALGKTMEANEKRNVEAIEQANESRANVHRRLDDITAAQSDLTTRTSHLETGIKTLTGEVGDMRQVTDDVKAMREQARGAGTLGQWLLKFGGWVLGAAATVVSFYTWITGRPPP
jgi:methyl-accepting chemotaxis protein